MIEHCQTLCLENPQGDTRWLRIVYTGHCLVAIESTEYAVLDSGYTMKFANRYDLNAWFKSQLDSGWQVSFRSNQPSDSIDTNVIEQVKLNIFNALSKTK
jgi:hypothetical protein